MRKMPVKSWICRRWPELKSSLNNNPSDSVVCEWIESKFGMERGGMKKQAFMRKFWNSQKGSLPELRPVKKTSKQERQKFYESREWVALRYQALKHYGSRCLCCGATPGDGACMHVDHIKPRSLHPELELSFDNLQVLCEACNIGKSNVDETDWRNISKTPIDRKILRE